VAVHLDPPLSGPWPTLGTLPDRVTVLGRSFVRAFWRQPRAGVLAQYREEVPERSMHLLVLDGGAEYRIDHVDDLNPDMGHAVGHFLDDHPSGRGLRAVVVAGTLMAGTAGIVVLARRAFGR